MIINKFINFYKEYKRIPTTSEVLRHFNVRFIEMPLPVFAQIEPTTRCNFNCITCTRKTLNPNRLNRDLTLEEFKIILDKIPTLKSIKLQGMGEPFLNPNLKTILEYGKKKGIFFTTICNGSILEYKLDLLKYFNYIFVSFDSANKSNFENIRKGSNFDVICKNLQSIVTYRNKHKLTTKIGLNSVITHLNYKEIPQIVKIANDFKLDSVGFVEVENWLIPGENNFSNDQQFIALSRKYSNKMTKLINKQKKKYPHLNIGIQSSKKRKSFCGWPFFGIFITVDGFITPCCIRMNPEVFNFGNIYQDDFNKIWNGEKYKQFRKSMIRNLSNNVCDNCPD